MDSHRMRRTWNQINDAIAGIARGVARWLSNPLIVIIAAALLGLGAAAFVAFLFSAACWDARAQWDLTTKRWLPGEAELLWWRVSAETCKDISTSPPWLLLSGLTAAPSVLLTWYWRDKKRRDDHELAVQVAFSDRYTKAAELLAHSDEMTRINGLESLWDIAIQSSAHRAAISRTFAAFVRTRSRSTPSSEPEPEVGILGRAEARTANIASDSMRADIQQAMTLLSRPEWAEWHRTRAELDLRRAHLRNVDVANAWMPEANFEDADLSYASLFRANLQGANLVRANLQGANLRGSNRRGTLFYDANLKDIRGPRAADLIGAMTNKGVRASDLEES